jgi:hypothetical protein
VDIFAGVDVTTFAPPSPSFSSPKAAYLLSPLRSPAKSRRESPMSLPSKVGVPNLTAAFFGLRLSKTRKVASLLSQNASPLEQQHQGKGECRQPHLIARTIQLYPLSVRLACTSSIGYATEAFPFGF